MAKQEMDIQIPEKAYHPESPEGREWWGMIAEGTVFLPNEVLDQLLKEVSSGRNEEV